MAQPKISLYQECVNFSSCVTFQQQDSTCILHKVAVLQQMYASNFHFILFLAILTCNSFLDHLSCTKN